MALHKLLFGLMALELLVGCGSDPATAPGSTASTAQVTAPSQYQAPAGGAAGAAASAKALQTDVQAAFTALKGYSGEIETKDIKGSKTIRSTANVKYMKPDQVRIDILSNSDDSRQAGTKAVWKGGDTMKIQPSGLLGFARVDLSTGDARLISQNGWKINQFSLSSNIGVFTAATSQVTVMGRGAMGSRTLVFAEVTGPLKVTTANKMKMGFDIGSKLPVYVDYLTGTTVIYQMRLSNVKIGAATPADFEL